MDLRPQPLPTHVTLVVVYTRTNDPGSNQWLRFPSGVTNIDPPIMVFRQACCHSTRPLTSSPRVRRRIQFPINMLSLATIVLGCFPTCLLSSLDILCVLTIMCTHTLLIPFTYLRGLGCLQVRNLGPIPKWTRADYTMPDGPHPTWFLNRRYHHIDINIIRLACGKIPETFLVFVSGRPLLPRETLGGMQYIVPLRPYISRLHISRRRVVFQHLSCLRLVLRYLSRLRLAFRYLTEPLLSHGRHACRHPLS